VTDTVVEAPIVDTARVEAFSDAVFAVAMTVLVFNLTTPAHRPGHLLASLLHRWPVYVSYLASFVYVGVIWMNHHAAFMRIRSIDRGLRIANLGILLHTVLIPFPTTVMSATLQESNLADSRAAIGLYAVVGALMCAAWWVFFHHLVRRPNLTEAGVPERFFAAERTRAAIGVVLYLAGALAGIVIAPVAALGIYLALPVFFGVTSEGLMEFRSRRAYDARRLPVE
jgi:uncharacterized membrane protein